MKYKNQLKLLIDNISKKRKIHYRLFCSVSKTQLRK